MPLACEEVSGGAGSRKRGSGSACWPVGVEFPASEQEAWLHWHHQPQNPPPFPSTLSTKPAENRRSRKVRWKDLLSLRNHVSGILKDDRFIEREVILTME